LTSENFNDIVGQDKYVVVKFYTKWCYYCKKMSPEYEKLVKHYEERKDLIIARIEASENDDIALRYGIHSFPRVVLYSPGDIRITSVFDAPRVLKFFVEWIDNDAPIKGEVKDKPKEEFMKDIKSEPKMDNEHTGIDDTHKIDLKINQNNEIGEEKMTSEFEYIKREMMTLRSRIELLEENMKTSKNNLNDTPSLEERGKKTHIYAPSSETVLIFGLIFIILIAGFLTVKRILIKSNGISHQIYNDKNI